MYYIEHYVARFLNINRPWHFGIGWRRLGYALGSADGWNWACRWCWRRLSHPDQDPAVLVVRQVLGLDEFNLEVFEVGIVELKAALQGAIGDPALALEKG